jgi:hypothetical protein
MSQFNVGISCHPTLQLKMEFMSLVDANEFKQAKIDVKMSIFLQFLLHLFM